MRPLSDTPSRSEMRLYQVLEQFWRENCVPPTIRQLQERAKVTSTSMVKYYLNALERTGYIEQRHGKPVPLWVIKALEVHHDA